MKKRAVIFIDIDTDRKGASGVGPGTPLGDMKIPGIEPYMVYINGDEKDRNQIDAAAHELGHALSSIFELPGGMLNDPRTCREFNDEDGLRNVTLDQADRIWSNECLAWKIAEKIRPGLDQDHKKECLDSYLHLYRMAA